MVYSAEYIKKKLEQEMILSQAFGRDLVRLNKAEFVISVQLFKEFRKLTSFVCTGLVTK